ncbi:hypothetical protein OROMI_034347 [Orobanche minor]
MMVMDDTNTTSFIVFSKEIENILKMSATDLVRRMEERGENIREFPVELNMLIDTKALFKISIKETNFDNPDGTTYTVLKVSTDESLIDSFIKLYGLDEIHKEIDCSPCTSVNDNTDAVSGLNGDTIAFSHDAMTLSKRSRENIINDGEDLTVQHSTSKLLKKIKLEKIE